MSDTTDNIIVDTATRIFRDLCEPATVNDAENGIWPTALWNALDESGLTVAWVPDDLGGAGATMADGFAVLRSAGPLRRAGPAGRDPDGRLAPGAGRDRGAGGAVDDRPGACRRPYRARRRRPARRPGAACAVRPQRPPHRRPRAARAANRAVALVDAAGLPISHDKNLAGEPRDTVSFDGAVPEALEPVALDADMIQCLGAAVRLQQMAGALEKILEQSVQYALDRSQFGRPIAKFQAVQHNLATLAGETAAAGAAADLAAEACAGPEIGVADIAVAKVRVGEAAGTGAAIAHQVHGAMGFTYEHSLHHATRRLWAWREEFGNESVWAARLGRMVAAQGADRLWPFITQDS